MRTGDAWHDKGHVFEGLRARAAKGMGAELLLWVGSQGD